MSDSEIETSDIPEVGDDAWAHAVRPAMSRPLKKAVTMRLDLDVLAWFKQQTERGYQTEINRVLRWYMLMSERRDSVRPGQIVKMRKNRRAAREACDGEAHA